MVFPHHPVMPAPQLATPHAPIVQSGPLACILEKLAATSLRLLSRLYTSREVHAQDDVCVIIVTRNNASTIRQSVLSVLGQTYINTSALVVLDRDCDLSTETIVKKIKQSHPDRVRLVRSPYPGLYNNKNFSINFVKEKWITFLDADDIAMPYRIEKQIKTHKSAGINFIEQVKISATFPFYKRFAAMNSIFLERKSYRELGGYCNITYGGDTEFVHRLQFYSRIPVKKCKVIGNLCIQRTSSLTRHPEVGTATQKGRDRRAAFISRYKNIYKMNNTIEKTLELIAAANAEEFNK